jgi:hypothetical protein
MRSSPSSLSRVCRVGHPGGAVARGRRGDQTEPNKAILGDHSLDAPRSCCEQVQQRLSLSQIGDAEALDEPAVDRSQGSPQAGEAGQSIQHPGLASLACCPRRVNSASSSSRPTSGVRVARNASKRLSASLSRSTREATIGSARPLSSTAPDPGTRTGRRSAAACSARSPPSRARPAPAAAPRGSAFRQRPRVPCASPEPIRLPEAGSRRRAARVRTDDGPGCCGLFRCRSQPFATQSGCGTGGAQDTADGLTASTPFNRPGRCRSS